MARPGRSAGELARPDQRLFQSPFVCGDSRVTGLWKTPQNG